MLFSVPLRTYFWPRPTSTSHFYLLRWKAYINVHLLRNKNDWLKMILHVICDPGMDPALYKLISGLSFKYSGSPALSGVNGQTIISVLAWRNMLNWNWTKHGDMYLEVPDRMLIKIKCRVVLGSAEDILLSPGPRACDKTWRRNDFIALEKGKRSSTSFVILEWTQLCISSYRAYLSNTQALPPSPA